MAITPQDVRDRFPEFSVDPPFTNTYIQQFIDKAVGELSVTEWGDQYNEGSLYFVAHFLALWSPSVSAGDDPVGPLYPVASRSVGDVSVSFAGVVDAAGSQSQVFWATTRYGQEYWRMVQLNGVGMLAV